ncbi:hypothetical protein F5J12DRAFT_905595 [Pisolithus orientalis]|uniref:uncharacterized protein n=1 Tax=Pisolithus orientalis TaxID=936130 RepID=UPI002224BED6|nr:uncharacterized protein F5J12DRAFT_905595 [Pisolithus orientalis]KAI6007770.1 hypothetical protein F5J12DRAFT_905595 [Pisolithus orientalis]
MAPSRAKQASKDTSDLGGKSKKKRRTEPEDALPGVQKIKSSLRQAKRLLSKESLAANVRVETERRVRALEADLVNAQNARKLRAMASRYHKVKFFERQKVTRKIKQVKRNLATTEGEEKARLELDTHYPPIKKYISLFPPEVRKPNASLTTVTFEDDDERSRIRKLIRSQMERGELSLEPENEQDNSVTSTRSRLRHERDDVNVASHAKTVSGDEFFGDDDNDGEQGSD